MNITKINSRNTLKGLLFHFQEVKDIKRQKYIAEKRLLDRSVSTSMLLKDMQSSKILNANNGDLFTGKIIEIDNTYSNGNQYILGIKRGVISSILLRNQKGKKIKLETLSGDKYFKPMTPDENQNFYDDVMSILRKIKYVSKEKRMEKRLNSRAIPYEDIIFSFENGKFVYKKDKSIVNGKIAYIDKNLNFYYLVKDGYVKAHIIKDKVSAKTVQVRKSINR